MELCEQGSLSAKGNSTNQQQKDLQYDSGRLEAKLKKENSLKNLRLMQGGSSLQQK